MENEFKLQQSQKEEFQCSADTSSRSKRDSSRQRTVGITADGSGNEFTDDRSIQQDSVGQSEQSNSEGSIYTGWESERLNGQVRQKQDERINAKGISDNVSDSNNQQSNISFLDLHQLAS